MGMERGLDEPVLKIPTAGEYFVFVVWLCCVIFMRSYLWCFIDLHGKYWVEILVLSSYSILIQVIENVKVYICTDFFLPPGEPLWTVSGGGKDGEGGGGGAQKKMQINENRCGAD